MAVGFWLLAAGNLLPASGSGAKPDFKKLL
jgi:hypothetical protein